MAAQAHLLVFRPEAYAAASELKRFQYRLLVATQTRNNTDTGDNNASHKNL
jgi:hypothetical protein